MLSTRKITESIALATAAVAILAGCSAGTATSADAPKSAPAAAAPAPTPKVTKPTFGKTVSYKGLDVQISTPVAFTPSEYASGGSLPTNVKFTFTAKNTGTKNYDPTLFSTTMTSGGQAANAVFDTEQHLGSAPQTTLLPGQTVTWEEGYNIANPKDITMDVLPGFEFEKSTWTL